MTHIDFGNFDVPIVSYAIRANAILGIRGAGKTHTSIYMAEKLIEWGCPITGVDPSGVWTNIKFPNSSSHGKGYDVVIIGGIGSDIVIDEDFNPNRIVEIVESAIANNISFIFNLYRSGISKELWGKILTLAFQTLYLKNSGIRHIFVEEAATFIPQNQKAFSKSLYEILEEITRIGGNTQLGITYISQRAEQLNKQCLELCDTVFLHRQRGNNSLKTMKKWIGMGVVDDATEVLSTMATLKAGECWIVEQDSPTPHRVNVPEKNSLHPDRTRFTESYLSKSLGSDVRSFVENATKKATLVSGSAFDYISLAPVMTTPPQPVEISTEIDWDSVLDSQKTLDRMIYDKACSEIYGGIPVTELINNLVRRGYTHYDEFGNSQAWLESDNNVHPFTLEKGIQQEYAKMLLRRLGL